MAGFLDPSAYQGGTGLLSNIFGNFTPNPNNLPLRSFPQDLLWAWNKALGAKDTLQNLAQSAGGGAPQSYSIQDNPFVSLPPMSAPPLPPPTTVGALPQPTMGGQDIPQDINPTIPQSAAPIQYQQPMAAAAPQQLPQQSGPDWLTRFARTMNPDLQPKLEKMSDFLGNQTPYWVDPVTQTIREAPIGSLQAQAGGLNPAALTASMNMPQQIDPTTGRDENFIKSLGPVLGAQVISALNGDSKLDGRMLQKIQPLAARAEPGWNQQTYLQRLGAYKSFYGGGKDQETVRALNQSAGHFAELVDKMNSLPGSQMPLLNWAANTYNTQFRGKGEANNFIVNGHALASELARIFKQNNLSDTEIRAWESNLSPNMSEEQQRGMARTLLGIYQESFAALEKKRADGLGPALAAKTAPIIDRHTQDNLDRVERFSIGQPTGAIPQGWGVRVIKQ